MLLTRADAAATLASVQTVIVDEWHELLGNKRGVQTQLAIARLRRWNPGLIVWGLSATLGNLDEALAGRIESRRPPRKPLDVLTQHMVSIALGGGFRPDELLSEVRSTHAYRDLGDDEWQWALDFVIRGGSSLRAYPEYHRVVVDGQGVHTVLDSQIAKRHRMSIGTIVSDAAMDVRYLGGGRIGHIEESFIGMLDKGDCFPFAGRHVHMGLANLAAWRIGRVTPVSFSLCVDDYGFELLSPTPIAFPLMIARIREKLSTEKVADRVQRMLAELEKYAAKG